VSGRKSVEDLFGGGLKWANVGWYRPYRARRLMNFHRDHLRAARARKEGRVKEKAGAKLLRLVDKYRDKMAIFAQFHPFGDERSPIGNRIIDPTPRPSVRK
jgi:hypothetical protein